MTRRKLKHKRTGCPIASWLDFFGDKWTLVIVRDLLAGKTRYNAFLESPEGIPTNILADRLKLLESLEIVTRQRYSDRPPRYEYRLTRRGAELLPALQQMSEWSDRHVAYCWKTPDWFREGTPDQFAS